MHLSMIACCYLADAFAMTSFQFIIAIQISRSGLKYIRVLLDLQ